LRRIVSSLIIALLLSLFLFAFNVQPAKAQSRAICINPDGSISPSTANITTSDNVTYTFTGNNYLPIVVNRSNIIIDGRGHTLQASGANGFSLTRISNVTIKNTTITNSYDGIDLESSSGNTLSGNNVTANSYTGIILVYSSDNVLSGNNATANGYGVPLPVGGDGIFLYYSSGNVLSDNNATANRTYGIYLVYSSGNVLSGNNAANNIWGDGIELVFSSGNVLSGNVMANNMYNFGVYAVALSDFVNHVDTSNLVDGKPVCYLVNQSNTVISPKTYPEGVGYLGLVNCKNVTVQGLTLTENVQGLLLANTNDSKITDNSVTANSYDGIILVYSSDNVLSGNNATANGYGVPLLVGGDGIFLYYSSGNVLSDNSAAANYMYGIFLNYSSGNVLSGNNAANSEYGIYLYSSSGNKVFHNDFLNNTQQASVFNSTNTWDDGYPSGGNYWSDYRIRYPNATELGGSAVSNMPYAIDANNSDRYPLMGSFHTFGVGTWNGTAYSVDTVCNSTITNVSFNVTAKILSFNVTGTNGTVGFCRVAIPLSLMSGEWTVTVNGTQVSPPILNVTTYGNYTYVYFTYHQSTEAVQIRSTSVIPEFQSYVLLPLIIMMTLLTASVSKRKRKVVHITKSAKE
jgi:parallel beta-helix repeat protein